MSKIILYIASSLDGFIARKDGDVSWLDAYQTEGQDYGYSEFLQGIDVIVMGSKTFEQLLTFGPWPYGNIETYVLSKRGLRIPEDAQVVLYSGSLDELVPCISAQSRKNIWLVGGAAVVQSFLRHEAVDKLILTIVPTLIGGGIPLFGNTEVSAHLCLLESRVYKKGVIQLHYSIGWSGDE